MRGGTYWQCLGSAFYMPFFEHLRLDGGGRGYKVRGACPSSFSRQPSLFCCAISPEIIFALLTSTPLPPCGQGAQRRFWALSVR